MEARLKLDSVLEKQRKRYLLLLKIYELTDGNEQKIIMLEPPEGVDEKDLMPLLDYLAGEGLVNRLANEAPLLQISHSGVVEVEQSLVNPKEPTEHFAATVIQHFHAAVGSVQTGNQNIASFSQNIGDTKTLELVDELRLHLDNKTPESEKEGNELLDGLETEVKAAAPNQSRIKLYLKGLGTFVKDSGQSLLVDIASRLISKQIDL